MASMITHLVLAQKLKAHLDITDKTAFILGNAFPDIRYLAKIDRNVTHQREITWAEVQNQDSFSTGINLHSWVDRARFIYMTEQQVQEIIPDAALKLYEDVVFYELLSAEDWKKLISCFDQVIDPELSFGQNKEQVAKWHQMTQELILNGPNDQTRTTFLTNIGLTPDQIRPYNQQVQKLSQNQQLKQVVLGLFEQIEELISRV